MNYQEIYLDFTKNLPERARKILIRRFGLGKEKPETLESIGKDLGITRERVRQIQESAFSEIKRRNRFLLEEIYQRFFDYFEKFGGLKKEDLLLADLGAENFQRYVYFFLTLGDPFFRYYEKRRYFPFWSTNEFSREEIENILDLFVKELREKGDLMKAENLVFEISLKHKNLSQKLLLSLLETSKEIGETAEGFYGLREWPEIHPRGVGDKAFLAFKKEKRPLHFVEVARLISPRALVQTVHNELIKDQRFVLIGQGIYALRDWGYSDGTVKEVILRILEEEKRALTKEEIIEKVLAQRIVKRNTILASLNDKNLFRKNSQGKYTLRRESKIGKCSFLKLEQKF